MPGDDKSPYQNPKLAADRASTVTVFKAVEPGQSAFTRNDRPRARSPSRSEIKRHKAAHASEQ